ncbi:MAG: 4Fe-4S dicluster domain-containing protein [Proteobacteria bacterium]|nr:4Fe-4S dicluster domain-containing protein [Pseudomonadota bacterium]
MDQEELRRLEYQCIQDEPPWCRAACPLHVDARAFAGHMARGNWDEAWKVLRRTMPLPGILGRVCDAPCRDRCKRSEAGDPIEIGALERFCVSRPSPRQRIQPLPAKDSKVAVIGSGLSGLTAAWDLSGKGYPVEVFEPGPRPAARLLERYPGLLTEEIITAELALLERLGVAIHLDHPVDESDFIHACLDGFQAVFLSLDIADPSAWGLDADGNGRTVTDLPWRMTGRPGLFAGGADESPVRRAAEGRWAATSMDRFLQNVSLTAGREKEGPYETRLHTSLDRVDPLPAVPFSGPEGTYTLDEARAEASRCLQCECLECVKVCPFLERFKAYPRKYAREIYNNESIVMGTRQANKLINSCSLCGLCERVCPQDFAMQDLCLEVRRNMVRTGKMPPSAHEFALLDMEFSQSDRFFLARHEPGRENGSYVFFPGCQLSAVCPDQAVRVYDDLRKRIEGGVGLMLGCCGAPAHWAGREDAFAREADRFRRTWRDLGRPRVVAACSTCLLMIQENLPEVDAVSLWQVWSDIGPPECRFQPAGPLAVHDPCTTRGREDVRAAVRRILDAAGAPFEELDLGRDRTECCGFGGLMQSANPDLAREVAARRAARSGSDYLAYCAMCRDSLAGTGKRVVHLLDLFFPLAGADPAERPRIGWSERRENRARLKARLLREIWKEDFERMEAHQKIRLAIAPEVLEVLDRRRILIEDVRKVIHHAETSGDRLLHPETGRYKASFKPYQATFWVEYSLRDGGYEVHNAYAHRMEVVGGGRL